ncbi:MAG: hypothetical protein KGH63_02595 [Candidatus Micrarchaeota archaeon]|nr:hypothetical protein [Candidatus Micrarchaeota archaeon]
MNKTTATRMVALLGLALVAVLAAGAAVAWILVIQPSLPHSSSGQMRAPSSFSAPVAPYGAVNPGGDAASRLAAQWALINNDNVQRACLSQAQSAATAQGYPAGVVSGCSCQAQESALYKSYQCQVSALDGQHPVSVACDKNQQSCQISSQQGTATYTFDQLQAMANA